MPDGDELDGLRRRMYRPGATEEDVRRYLGARPGDDPIGPAALPSRARRRAARPLVAVLVAVTTAAAVAVGYATTIRTPSSPAAPAAPVVRYVGSGAPVSDVDDGEHVASSSTGPPAPVLVPITVDGEAVVGQRFRGRGTVVVSPDTSAVSTRGGRAVVVLVSSTPAPIAWEAVRLQLREDPVWEQRTLASSAATARDGAAVPVAVPYRGIPPGRVVVTAPADATWTLLVAYTGASPADLR